MSAKFFPSATDLLERIIPEGIEIKTECLGELSSLKLLTPVFTALLVADAEQKNFKDSPSDCLSWAMETTGLERGYLRHLIRIGRVLLSVDSPVFDIMKYLNFRKLLDILTLARNEIPKFIISRGKQLIKMTDDEVRKEVYEVRGKDFLKDKSGGKYQPDMFDAVDALLEVEDEKLDTLFMDERFNNATVGKYYKSGMVLVENVVNYLNVRGGDPAVIATAEQQLRAQADKLVEIRGRMAVQLQAG